MTDRIQELRARCAEAAPHLWSVRANQVLDIAREALDGWEKAEARAQPRRKPMCERYRDRGERALRKALDELVRTNVSVLQRVDPYAVVGPDGIPRLSLQEAVALFVNAASRAADTQENPDE